MHTVPKTCTWDGCARGMDVHVGETCTWEGLALERAVHVRGLYAWEGNARAVHVGGHV